MLNNWLIKNKTFIAAERLLGNAVCISYLIAFGYSTDNMEDILRAPNRS